MRGTEKVYTICMYYPKHAMALQKRAYLYNFKLNEVSNFMWYSYQRKWGA